jgi:excinuclease ABC subunit A
LRDSRLVVTLPVPVPHNFSETEVLGLLEQQGYTRVFGRSAPANGNGGVVLEMIQDRIRFASAERDRVIEALESALRIGRGRVAIHVLDDSERSARVWRFSSDLHCADCDIHYREPTPSLFSFNSPLGACDSCRGFGRIIGIDFGLIVPDEAKSLRGGAVRPWQTQSYSECQDDLVRFARKRGVPLDTPWRELSAKHRKWVLEGEGSWEDKLWYGVRRFFAWLETKAYKMHIRVLLSKYRAYTPCTACGGARLKSEALLWRLGSQQEVATVLSDATRAGISVHELMLLPIERCAVFFERLVLPAPLDEASDLVLREIRSRLKFLLDVGLGYLTLDRQSRTLSGGEVQRINLTTALGTSLVNTLFVLDEPSIGLHPRDMGRVIGVMKRLKQSGNSLLVVEHDPQVMQAADRILDVGPGPGEKGGQIVFFDRPAQLAGAQHSLTADYLVGRKQVNGNAADSGWQLADSHKEAARLRVKGARQHNLKNIDVAIPLNRLVCITGVSGSGKSTLVQDVLYPALLKRFGRPTEVPGAHERIEGADALGAVVMVDQAQIGRTTRSNPASYVGAFDAIRKLYAAEPIAKERGYTLGTFSFNSGNGRCPSCGGNGFEHVEMQFLSDVYLRCAECNGRRYRAEILEVTLNRGGSPGRSIADVLDLTVSEAVTFFAGEREVLGKLEPLVEVGLDYLKLGQPVPTLSGGEAQRLKLAGHLAAAADERPNGAGQSAARGKLFLFDEPTTGLHFDDIAKLLRAFRRLIDAGHSLLVIEHNLDVIAAADWLIDLGPEGGDAGGEIVCEGTPRDVMKNARSHTGRALKEADGGWRIADSQPAPAEPAPLNAAKAVIAIHGAREHNLQNIDVEVPRNRLTVVTGVSGSGKSTLAFDIVFGEGQRRYLESLNAYARQFVQPASRPDVDAIFGIPPTVAIEQRTSRGGRKSTVATLTEIYHFLRLLYVKLGTQYCPDCDVPIEPQSFDSIAARVLKDYRGKKIVVLAPLVVARKGYYTDLAAWAAKKGYAHLRVDGALQPTDSWPRLSRFHEHTIELPVATLAVSPRAEAELRTALTTALDFGKGIVHLGVEGRTPAIFSTRRACPSCARSFAELDPRLFSFNSKHGWCGECFGTGLKLRGFDEEQTGEEWWWSEGADAGKQCSGCDGERLNEIARNVRFRKLSIAELTAQSVASMRSTFASLKLQGRASAIARDVLAEINSRLSFLEEVGLGYLALDRSAPTLSGGEAQRIRLAAQLGSNLQGVCYILDEPTIGLHSRDNRILLDTLARLAAKGNSLLVVEHDEDTIRRADHVIDLGPGAGTRGGHVVAAGTAQELQRSPQSITGRLLADPLRHPIAERRMVNGRGPALTIERASLHNLHQQTFRVPLARLVVVTGVSGSGKSTLARDVLHDNLRGALGRRRGVKPKWQGCRGIRGWEQVGRVLEVDQTPIGKTPRSCPATYVGFWDAIRRVFAETTEARMRGYTASRFSFNTAGGRCEGCEGQGQRRIEMSFLPDVRVVCDTCGGRRFNHDTLTVTYKGKNIGEVLMMSVDDAVDFFAVHPRIHHCLRLLQDVGLGYLTLGQQSPTLSGGEAQRIKLVTELSKVNYAGARANAASATLYVLDEPTVGLHMADVEKLIRVLHRLVDAGNTVVVIEHDLDVIAEADWIIDLGPEGGDEGGRLVVQGTPDDVARAARSSHTARVLKTFLRERSQPVKARSNAAV